MCEFREESCAPIPPQESREARVPDTTRAGTLSRRDLVKAGTGLAGGLALGGFHSLPARAAAAFKADEAQADDLRVYVVSIDSLDPVEVIPELMPNVAALRAEGIWYQSVGVLPSSSVQNHVAMVTGALPQDNGFVQNSLSNQNFGDNVDHLFTRLAKERSDVSTRFYTNWSSFNALFAARGKDGEDEVRPAGGFDPDPVGRFQEWALSTSGPQFGLLHLVDADAIAHALPTPEPGQAPSLAAARAEREAAIRGIDVRLGELVRALSTTNIPGTDETAWSRTIVLLVSDHRMEFAPQNGWIFIDLQLALGEDNYLAGLSNAADGTCRTGDFCTISNEQGGLFVGVNPKETDKIEAIAGEFQGIDGVALVATRQSTPSLADLGLDQALVGDIVVFAKEDHTFLPLFFGIHGHPLAQPNVLFVAGAHPWLADRPMEFVGFEQPTESKPANPVGRPSVLSVAPSVAWLFGLPEVSYYENDRLPFAFNRSEER